MKLWNLSAKNKGYGNDYYWNGTHFMTSAPLYVILKVLGFVIILHIAAGVKYGHGAPYRTIAFPRKWKNIVLAVAS